MEHIIVKRGGDQACEIEAGIAWALQQVQQNTDRRVTLVLSAPRGERGTPYQTTDLLNAIAGDLEAQPPRRDEARGRVETIHGFASDLADVRDNLNLQSVVNEWRDQLLRVINRTDIQAIEREGCDHRIQFEDGTISLTAMGEALAVALYTEALGGQSDRITIQSGYTEETAHERGYSDFTAVRLKGNEIHVHKAFAVYDGDPRQRAAQHIAEIRGEEAIRQAFGPSGYAHGVLQLAAVEELLVSGRPATVLVYNPADPTQVTRVYFEGALAIAA